jgi:hypothetical protein
MTDEERVETQCLGMLVPHAGTATYRSPLKLSPKRRLARTIEGLLYAVRQEYPGLSTEKSRMWLGLVLIANRNHLIAEAVSR